MKLNIIPHKEAPVVTPTKPVNPYADPVGWWEVTTEGDCEGRTTTKLGLFHGHMAEIAFNLANKCNYVLEFTKYVGKDVPATPDYTTPWQATRNRVDVRLSYSKAWSRGMDDRIAFYTKFMDSTDVIVQTSNYFESVELKLNM